MSAWLSCALTSVLIGLVTGTVVAFLHERWHIGPLRRRCWEAERALDCVHAVQDLRFPTLLCGEVGKPGDYMTYTSMPGRATCLACQAVQAMQEETPDA